MHENLLSTGLINGLDISNFGELFMKASMVTPQELKFLLLAKAYKIRVSDIATMLVANMASENIQ